MNMVSRLVPAAGEWPIKRARIAPEPVKPIQIYKPINTQAPTMKATAGPLNQILEDVARETGVSVACLIGPTRQAQTVRARHYAMWRMFTETGACFTQIAKVMGDRDHTSVRHAIQKHNQRIAAGI